MSSTASVKPHQQILSSFIILTARFTAGGRMPLSGKDSVGIGLTFSPHGPHLGIVPKLHARLTIFKRSAFLRRIGL
jgi:hypothetical protein